MANLPTVPTEGSGLARYLDEIRRFPMLEAGEEYMLAKSWREHEDVEAAQSIGREIATGTVFMNRCDYLDPALTWTGVKDTGRGATLSRLGYEALTRPKSYHLRTGT